MVLVYKIWSGIERITLQKQIDNLRMVRPMKAVALQMQIELNWKTKVTPSSNLLEKENLLPKKKSVISLINTRRPPVSGKCTYCLRSISIYSMYLVVMLYQTAVHLLIKFMNFWTIICNLLWGHVCLTLRTLMTFCRILKKLSDNAILVTGDVVGIYPNICIMKV